MKRFEPPRLIAGVFAGAVIACLPLGVLSPVRAEGPANSPYIDQLRREIQERDAEKAADAPSDGQSFIDSRRKHIEESDSEKRQEEGARPGESYIERLRREDPERFAKPDTSGYTGAEALKLETKEAGGAIRAVQEGRSELKPRYKDDISGAFHIRYGAKITRDYTGSADAIYQPFDDVYGGNYAPELSFLYEYQPFHSEILGNFGLVGGLGAAYFHGTGKFQNALEKPWSPGDFFGSPRTLFQFWTIPVSAGINYRFNLLHFLRPYVAVLPTATLYIEDRNDSIDAKRGIAKTIQWVGGVAILLDWIAPSNTWDAYHQNGIRHSYLTIEYTKVTSIGSDVALTASGLYAGMSFEF